MCNYGKFSNEIKCHMTMHENAQLNNIVNNIGEGIKMMKKNNIYEYNNLPI
jgi:hypothetical protein